MLFFVVLSVIIVATKCDSDVNFKGPSVYQLTDPVGHAEGPVWHGRKNILYFVDIHVGQVLAYHYETKALNKITLNGDVSPVVPSRHDPNLLLVGVNRSVVAVEWDGAKKLGAQEVLGTVAKEYPTRRFNDGKADKQGRLWWGTIGSETVATGVVHNQAFFYKITKENLANPKALRQVTNSNGLAWNKANDKLFYIDTPTRKVVEFAYNDKEGTISSTNRTAFDVAEHSDKIAGDPDGMTIDEDDNLWIALYNGGAVVKANPATGELLKVIPLPALAVTSAMWGGPDLDILFVTTSRYSLTNSEKLQQPGAGAVYAITGLGTKGLPMFTADIIDSIEKNKNILENLFTPDLFTPITRQSNEIYYPSNNDIPIWTSIMNTLRSFF